MAENRIQKLDQLLKSRLDADQIYISHTEKRLTTAGENYGSLMLAVEIELENTKTSQKETLNTVAKLIPPNEFLQKVFNVQVTFRLEIEFYKTIVPYLQKFQRDQGVGKKEILDYFPKFYGGRLSLDPNSTIVDEDAVLLLENLKDTGFGIANRCLGFDLETTEAILKNLAQFHAIPVAMKILKPEQFERELLQQFFKERTLNFPYDGERNEKTFQQLLRMVSHDCLCKAHSKRIREIYDNSIKYFQSSRNCRKDIRQPFATFIHTDFWVNNIMLKTELSGQKAIRMLDFQSYEYGSPAKDVIYFLYSSVEMKVVEKNYDHLLRFYYRTFMKTLEALKCNYEEMGFSFELFQNEIKKELFDYEFLHCLLMVSPIMAEKGSVAEIENFDEEHMFENLNSKQKEKGAFIVRELIKRNLI